MVANVSDEEMQEHYDNFFEDVFVELEDKYGEIEEMNVCDNLGDHLVGNVYIKVSIFIFCLNELKRKVLIFIFFFSSLKNSSDVKKMQNAQHQNSTIVGLEVVLFTLNYHQ